MIGLPFVLATLFTAPLAQTTTTQAPTATTAPAPGATLPAPSATVPASLPSTPAAPSAPAAPATPGSGAAPAGAPPPIVPANATYEYRFIPGQPKTLGPGQPQILAVYLNAKRLRSLGPISIRVLTSTNVVKVTTSSNGRIGTVPNVAAGDFEAKSRLPKLPFVASGITTTIDFIATTAAGKKVTVGVPVELQ